MTFVLCNVNKKINKQVINHKIKKYLPIKLVQEISIINGDSITKTKASLFSLVTYPRFRMISKVVSAPFYGTP